MLRTRWADLVYNLRVAAADAIRPTPPSLPQSTPERIKHQIHTDVSSRGPLSTFAGVLNCTPGGGAEAAFLFTVDHASRTLRIGQTHIYLPPELTSLTGAYARTFALEFWKERLRGSQVVCFADKQTDIDVRKAYWPGTQHQHHRNQATQKRVSVLQEVVDRASADHDFEVEYRYLNSQKSGVAYRLVQASLGDGRLQGLDPGMRKLVESADWRISGMGQKGLIEPAPRFAAGHPSRQPCSVAPYLPRFMSAVGMGRSVYLSIRSMIRRSIILLQRRATSPKLVRELHRHLPSPRTAPTEAPSSWNPISAPIIPVSHTSPSAPTDSTPPQPTAGPSSRNPILVPTTPITHTEPSTPTDPTPPLPTEGPSSPKSISAPTIPTTRTSPSTLTDPSPPLLVDECYPAAVPLPDQGTSLPPTHCPIVSASTIPAFLLDVPSTSTYKPTARAVLAAAMRRRKEERKRARVEKKARLRAAAEAGLKVTSAAEAEARLRALGAALDPAPTPASPSANVQPTYLLPSPTSLSAVGDETLAAVAAPSPSPAAPPAAVTPATCPPITPPTTPPTSPSIPGASALSPKEQYATAKRRVREQRSLTKTAKTRKARAAAKVELRMAQVAKGEAKALVRMAGSVQDSGRILSDPAAGPLPPGIALLASILGSSKSTVKNAAKAPRPKTAIRPSPSKLKRELPSSLTSSGPTSLSSPSSTDSQPGSEGSSKSLAPVPPPPSSDTRLSDLVPSTKPASVSPASLRSLNMGPPGKMGGRKTNRKLKLPVPFPAVPQTALEEGRTTYEIRTDISRRLSSSTTVLGGTLILRSSGQVLDAFSTTLEHSDTPFRIGGSSILIQPTQTIGMEAYAGYLALVLFKDKIAGGQVVCFSDNTGAVVMGDRRGRSAPWHFGTKGHPLALAIGNALSDIERESNILIQHQYVLRAGNKVAHALSQCRSLDDRDVLLTPEMRAQVEASEVRLCRMGWSGFVPTPRTVPMVPPELREFHLDPPMTVSLADHAVVTPPEDEIPPSLPDPTLCHPSHPDPTLHGPDSFSQLP